MYKEKKIAWTEITEIKHEKDKHETITRNHQKRATYHSVSVKQFLQQMNFYLIFLMSS